MTTPTTPAARWRPLTGAVATVACPSPLPMHPPPVRPDRKRFNQVRWRPAGGCSSGVDLRRRREADGEALDPADEWRALGLEVGRLAGGLDVGQPGEEVV